MISIKKGLNLPISGGLTDTTIHSLVPQASVGIVGDDYIGLKPTMLVAEGDKVTLGQALFEDKKNLGVFICSPVSGTIQKITRGEKRKFISITIEPDFSAEKPKFSVGEIKERATLVEVLTKHGLWTAFRQRPFDKIPAPKSTPHAIFVNTMDSNPLSFNPAILLDGRTEDYQAGIKALSLLTEGKIHVAHAPETKLPDALNERVQHHAFGGLHPAGLVGTHIHFIDPVSAKKVAWHISLQDLLMVGKFLRTGELDTSKVVAIAGPSVKEPKLVRTVRGANLSALTAGNLKDSENRIISGSVFSGRQAGEFDGFLGAYDQQISVLPEGRETYFLRFFHLGQNTYSKTRSFLSFFLDRKALLDNKGQRTYDLNTSMQGSPRPIVPFGIYEDVMPLDILPTLLLKALIVLDTDTAVELGALELVEEDVALLSFVDSGKHDFGAILRENLTIIEQEG
ncbi:MAG: Na(+)-translocating NADH-quinone reductase subunit A [Cardiobacteriaceae bacterium]|nr:Na(+)-translocating NADH-quinone reductase subunit A [Cardiobacteriaceae bacterium]